MNARTAPGGWRLWLDALLGCFALQEPTGQRDAILLDLSERGGSHSELAVIEIFLEGPSPARVQLALKPIVVGG